jgi:hypothetical protein
MAASFTARKRNELDSKIHIGIGFSSKSSTKPGNLASEPVAEPPEDGTGTVANGIGVNRDGMGCESQKQLPGTDPCNLLY